MVGSRKAYGRVGAVGAVMLGAAMTSMLVVTGPACAQAQGGPSAKGSNPGLQSAERPLRPDRSTTPTMLHFSGPNRTGVAYCAARKVVFRGDRGRIALRGGCRSLTIEGSNNDVTVEIEAGALIQVRGQHNTIHWHVVAGTTQPRIQDLGRNNTYKTQP